MPKDSYVASLFGAGEDRIIQKVGEEATEVIIAVKNGSKERLISEVADLFFHLLVLMAQKNLTLPMIYAELEKRRKKTRIHLKTSGIDTVRTERELLSAQLADRRIGFEITSRKDERYKVQ